MEKKYCIFEVSDYKGGELHSHINLTKKELVYNLGENFEDVVLITDSLEEIKSKIIKEEKDEDFYGTYAGSQSRFCGKIYEIVDSKLVEVDISNFIDDIAKTFIE